MSWRRNLQRLLLQTIFLVYNIGTVFGLTTFYYSQKHKSFVDSELLNRYSKFMCFTFFCLYPISVLAIQDFHSSSGVTDQVRNGVFVATWLICSLILVSQASHAERNCNLYNRAGALFVDITNNQSESFRSDDNFKLNLSAKCVLKTCLLAFGFLLVNISKFHYRIEARLSMLESVLFICLFVPSFIMSLASNRFYVATTFCLYLMMRINNNISELGEGYRGLSEMAGISIFSRQLLRMTAGRISMLAEAHAELHQLFVEFHAMYAKYIVLILGFCFLNVVFEVKRNYSFEIRARSLMLN